MRTITNRRHTPSLLTVTEMPILQTLLLDNLAPTAHIILRPIKHHHRHERVAKVGQSIPRPTIHIHHQRLLLSNIRRVPIFLVVIIGIHQLIHLNLIIERSSNEINNRKNGRAAPPLHMQKRIATIDLRMKRPTARSMDIRRQTKNTKKKRRNGQANHRMKTTLLPHQEIIRIRNLQVVTILSGKRTATIKETNVTSLVLPRMSICQVLE
mmetsp:Transcript_50859/g.59418  ORF Transcript_50859/g.59418 Transcript_50859/m.59418 type:complete len:210 (+) Transcript_50859:224-853(+)